MKLIKRLVLFGVLGIIVLVVAGGIFLTLSINSIARRGVEVGATSALGVETKLKSASIGLFSGKFGLAGLDVSNPKGYPSTHFVQLGDANVAVSLTSLTKDTIEVPSFSMDGLAVRLERRAGKSNYEVILEHLEKLSGGKKDPAKPAEPKKEGGEKRFVIKQLTLRNITIHADMVDASTPGLAEIAKVSVPIPEIKLENVGQTGEGLGGSGVTIGELSSIIVQTIMAAAVELGGVLPDQLLGELKARLSGLGGLKGIDLSFITESGGNPQALGQQFGAKVTDVGTGVKKAVEDAVQGLPGGDKLKEDAAKQIDKATEKLKGLLPKKEEPKK